MKTLPKNPNLDHLRHEAKALLKAHRQGEAGACAILRNLPVLAKASDLEITAVKLTLQQAQHALALEYGFPTWKALRDQAASLGRIDTHAQEARKAFTQKGPPENSTGSTYEQELFSEIQRLLQLGAEGFAVAQQLAKSANGRLRNAAAMYFSLANNSGSKAELIALMQDEAVAVRSRAVRFYASQIHPARTADHIPHYWEPAQYVPEGIDQLFPMLEDESLKVQLDAIHALTPYTALQDKGVLTVLQARLKDTSHKIQHAAAKALAVQCPGCDKLDVR